MSSHFTKPSAESTLLTPESGNIFGISQQSIIIAAVLLLSGFLYLQSKTSNRRYPPSPKAFPVVGHTIRLAGAKYTWRELFQMSKEANAPDIMYLKLGTSDVVVISSCKAQAEIEKKGAIYSDRPRMVVPTELISNNRRVVLTYYGERWRKMRKFLHAVLYDKQAEQYEPVQERETKAFMLNLLDDPDNCNDHAQLFSSNVILQTTFHRRATTVKDKDIQDLLYDVGTWMLSANPGAHPVHDFPILDKLPDALAPWRKYGRGLHKFEMDLYTSLAKTVKDKIARGERPESIMLQLFERGKEFGLDDEDVLYLAGTLFEAGSDTTTSLLISLFLACANDETISREAQKEVDRVVGQDRMPSFKDMGDMPYIEALALECQRWRPAVPSAVPHATTEEDVFMGYHVPKGATVIINTWAIGRDPEVFKDPEAFRPQRYLPGAERDKIFSALAKGHTGFGAARRICPGLHMAERSLFITIASIFWAFDVKGVPNEKADVDNFSRGFVSHSHRFKVSIKPRSEKKAAIIRSEATAALAEMASAFD